MGRKRKTNKTLPNRVIFKHGAYFFIGKSNKWHHLGKTLQDMYEGLAGLSIEAAESDTMGAVFKRYRNEIIPGKAPKTQKENERQLKCLAAFFGGMRPQDIEPLHVYQYMDERPPVSANREKALLRHVFKKGVRWGCVRSNPCLNLESNRERARDRFVTDDEYLIVYEKAPHQIQIAMELARITGMRQADILKLRWSDITSDGLYVRQQKTGKQQLFEVTPSLRLTLSEAKNSKVQSIYLVNTKSGGRYTSSGFQTVWGRLIRSVKVKPFQFRDLRAKAGSEAEDTSRLLGNTEGVAKKHYRRKPEKVKPNE